MAGDASKSAILEHQIAGLQRAVKAASPQSRIGALGGLVEEVKERFLRARQDGTLDDDTKRAEIENQVRDLWTTVETAQAPSSARQGWWNSPSLWGGLGLSLAVLLVAFIVYRYAHNAGWSTLTSTEGMRPIIALAAIMATLVYGGSLMIGALFSSEGPFEDRFRMAREIFLIFSGVFATIVGFHFGSANGGASVPVDQSSSVYLVADEKNTDTLRVSIQAGIPPYGVRLDGPEVVPIRFTNQPSEVEVQVRNREAGKPLTSVTLTVTDASRRLIFQDTLDVAELAKLGYKSK